MDKARAHRGQLVSTDKEFSYTYVENECYLMRNHPVATGTTATVHEAWLIKKSDAGSYEFKPCAIKHFLDDYDRDNELTDGVNEFLALGKVYPGVKHGIISGKALLVMPFFGGKPICNDEGKFDVDIQQKMSILQRFDLINAIIEKVALLHKSGYIHRDISAQNILFSFNEKLGDVQANLTDFGLATEIKSTRPRIDSPGTPGYLAPERTKFSSKITDKADIFSLTPIFALILGASNPLQQKLKKRKEYIKPIKKALQILHAATEEEQKREAHAQLQAILQKQNIAEASVGFDFTGLLAQNEYLKNQIKPFLELMQDPDSTKRPDIEQVKEFFQILEKAYKNIVTSSLFVSSWQEDDPDITHVPGVASHRKDR